MTCTTATINEYDIGDTAHTTCLFKTAAGVAVDPPVVLCIVEYPDKTEITYTYLVDVNILRKDSVGNYSCYVPVTMAGLHTYKWFAVDAAAPIYQQVKGAQEGQFIGKRSVIGS